MNHIYLIRLIPLKRPGFQSQKYGIPSVAVALVRPLHVSKVGQSKKGKTKQATLISDFHAYESQSPQSILPEV